MLTQSQKNAITVAVAALDCLALHAAGRSPYAERADARFDAECQRDNLKRSFPDLFPQAKD